MFIRDYPGTNAVKVGRLFLNPGDVYETITQSCRMVFHEASDRSLPLGRAGSTEAEWEFAARGGLESAEFVWGDGLTPDGKHMANPFQGDFPWRNTIEDGFEYTAPVGTFPPNGYGPYDMAGNVWQRTSDWYQEHSKIDSPCCTASNPRGGTREGSLGTRQPDVKSHARSPRAARTCARRTTAAPRGQDMPTAAGYQFILTPSLPSKPWLSPSKVVS